MYIVYHLYGTHWSAKRLANSCTSFNVGVVWGTGDELTLLVSLTLVSIQLDWNVYYFSEGYLLVLQSFGSSTSISLKLASLQFVWPIDSVIGDLTGISPTRWCRLSKAYGGVFKNNNPVFLVACLLLYGFTFG